mmetsp:Transcript_12321/g.21005  ORF Transcript_12321/g.21005 Transcript_12321/m.21005 type:complete len:288 (+) Transcript_12321:1800-2663(+)
MRWASSEKKWTTASASTSVSRVRSSSTLSRSTRSRPLQSCTRVTARPPLRCTVAASCAVPLSPVFLPLFGTTSWYPRTTLLCKTPTIDSLETSNAADLTLSYHVYPEVKSHRRSSSCSAKLRKSMVCTRKSPEVNALISSEQSVTSFRIFGRTLSMLALRVAMPTAKPCEPSNHALDLRGADLECATVWDLPSRSRSATVEFALHTSSRVPSPDASVNVQRRRVRILDSLPRSRAITCMWEEMVAASLATQPSWPVALTKRLSSSTSIASSCFTFALPTSCNGLHAG